MTYTAASILRAAKALISLPSAWTQGTCARNAKGKAVATADNSAVQFCSIGAIWKISGPLPFQILTSFYNPVNEAIKCLHNASPISHISKYNDAEGRTHADIMRLFDNAIKQAERLEE